jgi:hypothetical protein
MERMDRYKQIDEFEMIDFDKIESIEEMNCFNLLD